MAIRKSKDLGQRCEAARDLLPADISGMLPSKVADSVESAAKSKGATGIALLGMFLAAVSHCTGFKAEVTLADKMIDWSQVLIHWHLLVSPSGTNKSPLIKGLNEIMEAVEERANRRTMHAVKFNFSWTSVSFYPSLSHL